MPPQVCVDASLALKLVLPEDDSPVAQARWEAWGKEDLLQSLPVRLLYPAGLHRRAWEWARQFDRPSARP